MSTRSITFPLSPQAFVVTNGIAVAREALDDAEPEIEHGVWIVNCVLSPAVLPEAERETFIRLHRERGIPSAMINAGRGVFATRAQAEAACDDEFDWLLRLPFNSAYGKRVNRAEGLCFPLDPEYKERNERDRAHYAEVERAQAEAHLAELRCAVGEARELAERGS